MSLGFEAHAGVRVLAPRKYGSGVFPIDQNPRGDLCVAQGLLSKAELTRLGDSWSMQVPTGSAYTNVAGMPTTRAELVAYNGEPAGGKIYVIDTAWMLSLTSITAAACATLICQVAQGLAAPTDNGAVLINSPMGKTYSGNVKRALGVTTFTANKWSVLAVGSTGGATATIGFGIHAEVNGGIILRPGDSLGLNAVVGTATGTSLIGFSWHEVHLPIP